MRFLILFGAGTLALLLIIRLLNLQVRRRRDHQSTTTDGSGPIIEGSVVEPSSRIAHDNKAHDSDHHGDASSDSGGGGDGGGGD